MIAEKDDALKGSDLGLLVSSTLHKLEHISDHHVKERRGHFRVTNTIVIIVSVLLLLIACINMYYLYHFYIDSKRIIDTAHGLDDTVLIISKSMKKITGKMEKFSQHLDSMPAVYDDISSLTEVMPTMQKTMVDFQMNVKQMNTVMNFVNKDIQLIGFHLSTMTQKVSYMGSNIQQLAKPMGMFNGILP